MFTLGGYVSHRHRGHPLVAAVSPWRSEIRANPAPAAAKRARPQGLPCLWWAALLLPSPEPNAPPLDVIPSKMPTCTIWPTLPDAKPLLDLERLPTNMELWGSGLLPDFWRYQVESKIRGFDLDSAGFIHENITCWFIDRGSAAWLALQRVISRNQRSFLTQSRDFVNSQI